MIHACRYACIRRDAPLSYYTALQTPVCKHLLKKLPHHAVQVCLRVIYSSRRASSSTSIAGNTNHDYIALREQHKALLALGAKLEELMTNGPEDWFELWRLEACAHPRMHTRMHTHEDAYAHARAYTHTRVMYQHQHYSLAQALSHRCKPHVQRICCKRLRRACVCTFAQLSHELTTGSSRGSCSAQST